MKAVWIKDFGGPENLEIREVPDPPQPAGNEVLVRVRAAGLNRADLLQRRGYYPPPPGVSPNIPGLEFAGEVAAVGGDVTSFSTGDRVFGITAGEAQAELLLTRESLLTKIPENLSYTDAAAIPEAFITAHDAMFTQGRLRSGESALIHAVGSGVGLAGLQLAKAAGVFAIGTSRTAEKIEACSEFGLDHGIVAGEPNFAGEVKELTDGKGVDLVLDLVGGAYFPQNVESLALKGRLLLVGLTAGAKAQIDLGAALAKRLTIIGTVLRPRPEAEKAEAVRAFERDVVPLFDGMLRPVVDRSFAYRDVAAAHAHLESNGSFGKVVLEF